MANKFVAVFLMCIVVVAAFVNPAASDCYGECFDNCKARGADHSDLYCDSVCQSSCDGYWNNGRF